MAQARLVIFEKNRLNPTHFIPKKMTSPSQRLLVYSNNQLNPSLVA